MARAPLRDDRDTSQGVLPQLPLSPSQVRAAAARRALESLGDGKLRRARGLLWATLVVYALLALAAPPTYAIIMSRDAELSRVPNIDPTIAGIFVGLFLDVFFLPLGASALAGVIGIRRGERWGFVFGTACFAMLVLLCPPAGIYGLHALLRERVRHVFYAPG